MKTINRRLKNCVKGRTILELMKNLLFTPREFVLTVLFFCLSSFSASANQSVRLENQMKKLASGGIILLNDETGQPLFHFNPDKKLLPASLFKIPLVIAAMEIMGKKFRFITEIYLNSKNDLLIKGFGDPFLVSKEILIIAQKLSESKISKINSIFLDISAFSPNIVVPGVSETLNPYDALNGALIVNFNTVFVRKDKSGVIISAEPETPLTPLARKKGALLKRGTQERFNLGRNDKESLLYTVELFRVLFQQSGIKVKKQGLRISEVNTKWKLIYYHKSSRSISSILEALLKYSNNYIANQFYLTLGAMKYGYPATMKKGTKAVLEYLVKNLKMSKDEIEFDEGSGISRNTQITGKSMMLLMEYFRKYIYLMADVGGVLRKSGTLTGVYNYAGYIKAKKGFRPFVIITNNKKNNRLRILNLLKKYSNLY